MTRILWLNTGHINKVPLSGWWVHSLIQRPAHRFQVPSNKEIRNQINPCTLTTNLHSATVIFNCVQALTISNIPNLSYETKIVR